MSRQKLGPRWTISRNATGFIGEYREPGQEITAKLSGTTEKILRERIAAREKYREANGLIKEKQKG
jgi:hypothetical protein